MGYHTCHLILCNSALQVAFPDPSQKASINVVVEVRHLAAYTKCFEEYPSRHLGGRHYCLSRRLETPVI